MENVFIDHKNPLAARLIGDLPVIVRSKKCRFGWSLAPAAC